AEVRAFEAVVERTVRDVLAMGGTVSAEHGIGKLKARWLPLQLSPTQVAMLRAIKRELDPRGILAPGNILGSAA
ncbi:MAG: FAD-binding oxidoreductase, partial [Gemmatimonadetes bacterium]|nr:FAD-binding oxidoreductase [Gemmatimonadota bacterium]